MGKINNQDAEQQSDTDDLAQSQVIAVDESA